MRLFPDVFRPLDSDARPDDAVTERIEGERSDILVAELDGELVGLAALLVSSYPDVPVFHPTSFAYIDEFVVDPARQRSGIGRLLMEAVVAWARDRGLSAVQTNVWLANEAARAFYERAGFAPTTARMRLPLPPHDEPAAKEES